MPALDRQKALRCLSPRKKSLRTNGRQLKTRSFQPGVPPDTLRELIAEYDDDLAALLVKGFTDGFYLGCNAAPVGDCSVNLPSCDEAPQVISLQISLQRLPMDALQVPFHPTARGSIFFRPSALFQKSLRVRIGSFTIFPSHSASR